MIKKQILPKSKHCHIGTALGMVMGISVGMLLGLALETREKQHREAVTGEKCPEKEKK